MLLKIWIEKQRNIFLPAMGLWEMVFVKGRFDRKDHPYLDVGSEPHYIQNHNFLQKQHCNIDLFYSMRLYYFWKTIGKFSSALY